MFDKLKIQFKKKIIFEKFCQNLKVWCFHYMICEVITFTIQIVSNALSMTDDQPFGNSSVEYTMGLVTCVRSRRLPKKNLRNKI